MITVPVYMNPQMVVVPAEARMQAMPCAPAPESMAVGCTMREKTTKRKRKKSATVGESAKKGEQNVCHDSGG